MADTKPANFWAPADDIIASTRLPNDRRSGVRIVAPSTEAPELRIVTLDDDATEKADLRRDP
jgi:hypothetical protein